MALLKFDSGTIAKIQAALLMVLIVYVAYLCAGLFWHYFAPDSSQTMVLPQSQVTASKQTQNRGSQLARFHLFGKEGRRPVKTLDTPKEAPKTNLRLVLKGVFTSEQAGASGAIVEEIGKKSGYYGVGDTLPGNAVLEEVYNDRILLRRNGRLETLAFVDKKTAGGQSYIAKNKPIKKVTKTPSRVSPHRVDTPEKFIEEAAVRLADNPAQALNSVGLKASEGGYVYQGGNPMLSGLNLNKGDVIRSVNGHSLGDIQKDKDLMKSLYQQGSLEVEIMRDGASFYINYPLR